MPINESDFNKTIKETQEYIETVINTVQMDEGNALPSGEPEPMMLFSNADLGTLRITGESIEKYDAVLESLYKAVVGKGEELVSKKQVKSLLQTTILKVLDANEKQSDTPIETRLKHAIRSLRRDLKEPPTTWECHLLVLGVYQPGLPFTAGKVTFLPGDAEQIGKMVEDVRSVNAQSPSSPEVKATQVEGIEKHAVEHFTEKTIAVVEVNALDEAAARQLAARELQLHIDVLNHFSDIAFIRDTRIYRPGDAEFRAANMDLLFTNKTNARYSNVGISLGGPMSKYSFEQKYIDALRGWGFLRALDILKKDERNTFEKKVLAALQWAGRATNESEIEKSFLFNAIALKSLLVGGQNKTDVTYKVCTRCAHLIGTDWGSRHTTFKTMQSLYAIRSQIVHTGSFDVTPEDLGSLVLFTKQALAKVLMSDEFTHMTKEEHLNDWFETRILS